MKIIYYDNKSLQLDVSDDFIVVMELAYTYHNRKKKKKKKNNNNKLLYLLYIVHYYYN